VTGSADFYNNNKILYPRYGHSADKGDPPDKSALFWALDTGKMYAVNDSMQWVEVNPDPPQAYHVHEADVATSIFPSTSMFFMDGIAPLIVRIHFDILEPYDVGTILTLGDAGDVDRFFDASSLDATTVGTYEVEPFYKYPSVGSDIRVYSNLDPTTGLGKIHFEFDEDPI